MPRLIDLPIANTATELYGWSVKQPGLDELAAGFDAIVQMRSDFIDEHLQYWTSSHGRAGILRRIPYVAADLSQAVRDLSAPHLPMVASVGDREYVLEVRTRPLGLRTLRGTPDPILDPTPTPPLEAELDPTPDSPDPAAPPATTEPLPWVQVGSGIEVALVIRTRELVAYDPAFSSGRSAPPVREQRFVLASGLVVTSGPTTLTRDKPTLTAWMDLDLRGRPVTHASPTPALTSCLEDAAVAQLIEDALAPLTSGTVRLTPTFAWAGDLSVGQIAQTGLVARFRVRPAVRVAASGREVLCLCVDMIGSRQGTLSAVQPFPSAPSFCSLLGADVVSRVLVARWKAHPSLRVFTRDVPIEVQREGHDESEEARGRVRVRWRDVPLDIRLSSPTTHRDDAIRVESDSELQVVAFWDPDGHRVEDLGELGQAIIEPLVVWCFLFDEAPAVPGSETQSEAVKRFARVLFRPIIRPMLGDYVIVGLSGVTSASAGAVLVRGTFHAPGWKPIPRPEAMPTTGGVLEAR